MVLYVYFATLFETVQLFKIPRPHSITQEVLREPPFSTGKTLKSPTFSPALEKANPINYLHDFLADSCRRAKQIFAVKISFCFRLCILRCESVRRNISPEVGVFVFFFFFF